MSVGLLEASLYSPLFVEGRVDLLCFICVADASEVELGRNNDQLLLHLRPLQLLARHGIFDDGQLGEGIVLCLEHLGGLLLEA